MKTLSKKEIAILEASSSLLSIAELRESSGLSDKEFSTLYPEVSIAGLKVLQHVIELNTMKLNSPHTNKDLIDYFLSRINTVLNEIDE